MVGTDVHVTNVHVTNVNSDSRVPHKTKVIVGGCGQLTETKYRAGRRNVQKKCQPKDLDLDRDIVSTYRTVCYVVYSSRKMWQNERPIFKLAPYLPSDDFRISVRTFHIYNIASELNLLDSGY